MLADSKCLNSRTNPTSRRRTSNPTGISDRTSLPRPHIHDRSNSATAMSTAETREGVTTRPLMALARIRMSCVGFLHQSRIMNTMACVSNELTMSQVGFWKQVSFGGGGKVGPGLLRLSRSVLGIREWAKHIWGEWVFEGSEHYWRGGILPPTGHAMRQRNEIIAA